MGRIEGVHYFELSSSNKFPFDKVGGILFADRQVNNPNTFCMLKCLLQFDDIVYNFKFYISVPLFKILTAQTRTQINISFNSPCTCTCI